MKMYSKLSGAKLFLAFYNFVPRDYDFDGGTVWMAWQERCVFFLKIVVLVKLGQYNSI